MKSRSDLYEILGVSSTSEAVVIEAAYRALMREYQPRVARDAGVAAKVQMINAAYSTLINPRKRSLYDASLKTGTVPPAEATSHADSDLQTQPAPALRSHAGEEAPTESRYRQDDQQWGRLIVIGIIGFFAIVILANLDSETTENQSTDSSIETTNDVGTAANKAVAVTKEEQPSPLVLDEKIAFSNPANCVASPALDQAYEDLLPTGDAAGPWAPRTVSIGDLRLTPKLEEFVKASDPPGTIAKLSSVRLPRGSVWHGLRVSRLLTSYYAQPDTDATYSRSITFRATPDEVRAVLTREGFNPPTEGTYSSLTDNVCGGAMFLLPVTGGSELRCSWGC